MYVPCLDEYLHARVTSIHRHVVLVRSNINRNYIYHRLPNLSIRVSCRQVSLTLTHTLSRNTADNTPPHHQTQTRASRDGNETARNHQPNSDRRLAQSKFQIPNPKSGFNKQTQWYLSTATLQPLSLHIVQGVRKVYKGRPRARSPCRTYGTAAGEADRQCRRAKQAEETQRKGRDNKRLEGIATQHAWKQKSLPERREQGRKGSGKGQPSTAE
jgi:hypothetical protein